MPVLTPRQIRRTSNWAMLTRLGHSMLSCQAKLTVSRAFPLTPLSPTCSSKKYARRTGGKEIRTGTIRNFLPGTPTSSWANSKGSVDKLTTASVRFYTTTFGLKMSAGYDIPPAIDFGGSLTTAFSHRCHTFVNGYQFGKFFSNAKDMRRDHCVCAVSAAF